MPTVPQTPAQHHYAEAERILALLGSLGVNEEEATREAMVALTHTLLAVAARLSSKRALASK